MPSAKSSILLVTALTILPAGCAITSTPAATDTPRPPTNTPAPTASPLPPTQTNVPEPTTIPELDDMGFPGGVAFTLLTEDGPEIYGLIFEIDVFGPLTDSGGTSFQPRWSPDGEHLLYAAGPGVSEVDIFRANIRTGAKTRLTTYGLWDAHPVWSPDGEQIAFVSDRLEDGSGPGLDDIWIMASEGSNQTNLTNQPNWEDVKPAWSPDGEEIAFFRWNILAEPDAEGGPSGLWAIKPDGSGERLISAEVEDAGLLAEAPEWSPDGTMIAYAQLGGIFVVHVEDGALSRIADEAGDEFGVSWSPDSRAILFSTESDAGLSLYITLADGSAIWEVIEGGGAGIGHWSPF